MAALGEKPKIGEIVLQHVIVFAICIVFPGLTTAVIPASWVTFERSGNVVRCTARTCVYFVVPYRVQRMENVTAISQREIAGGTRRQREHGRETNKSVDVQGEGFLQIRGPDDQFIEVSVSPASLNTVVAKSSEFLNSPAESSRTLFVIANWKFGMLMGGTLTMFTVLYVVGYSLQFLKSVATGLRRMLSGGAGAGHKMAE